MRYFNAVVHNGDEEKNLVSYNPSLHETMAAAKLKDKPVKFLNFMERMDEFRGQQIITLGDRSSVEYSSQNLQFSKVEEKLKKFNVLLSLKDVLDEVAVDGSVNVVAHVRITSDTIDINTQYGEKRKRDVYLSDDSTDSIVKLSLWNNHIDQITTDGSYKFQDLRLKCYNGKYLTSTSLTVVAKATQSFKERTWEETSKSDAVSFPADSIDHFEETYFCQKCRHRAIPEGLFFACADCGSRSLMNKGDKRYFVKLTFRKSDATTVTLTMPHRVLLSFMENKELQSADEIQIEILTNTKFEARY